MAARRGNSRGNWRRAKLKTPLIILQPGFPLMSARLQLGVRDAGIVLTASAVFRVCKTAEAVQMSKPRIHPAEAGFARERNVVVAESEMAKEFGQGNEDKRSGFSGLHSFAPNSFANFFIQRAA